MTGDAYGRAGVGTDNRIRSGNRQRHRQRPESHSAFVSGDIQIVISPMRASVVVICVALYHPPADFKFNVFLSLSPNTHPRAYCSFSCLSKKRSVSYLCRTTNIITTRIIATDPNRFNRNEFLYFVTHKLEKKFFTKTDF